MATPELQATTNLLKRVLDKIKLESSSVATAKLAVIIAILALILSALISISAWSDAKEANIRSEFLSAEMEKVKDEVEVYEVYILNLHSDLKARGFQPPALPEEK